MERGGSGSGIISPAGRERGVKKGEEEGGRRVMCEAVERYAERKRIDALYETLMNLMETMKWTAEQAMEAMKVSETDKKLPIPRL